MNKQMESGYKLDTRKTRITKLIGETFKKYFDTNNTESFKCGFARNMSPREADSVIDKLKSVTDNYESTAANLLKKYECNLIHQNLFLIFYIIP